MFAVDVYVYFHACVDSCSFDFPDSHPSYSDTRTIPLFSSSPDRGDAVLIPGVTTAGTTAPGQSSLPRPLATVIGLVGGKVLKGYSWSCSNKLIQKGMWFRFVQWKLVWRSQKESRRSKSGFMDTTMEGRQWGQLRGEHRNLPSLNGIVWVPTFSLPVTRWPPDFLFKFANPFNCVPSMFVSYYVASPCSVLTLYYPLSLKEWTICLHLC